MRVVLASRNTGKLKELRTLLAPTSLQIESQADYDIPRPDETGTTYVENAIIKARTVAQATGHAALGDDSGLVVPALNGAPGIFSARYAGRHGDDGANNQKLIAALREVDDRQAYFYCAMVLLRHAEDPTPIIATAAWHGQIVSTPSGAGGFGYDPIFLVPELGKTAAELESSDKNQLSHRGQAIAKLLDALPGQL